MYIRPEQIAEQYEMEVKSISKGRDCFLCETDLGMRALKEYRGSVERAEFLAGMLDFLKGQNIVAEQIFYTKEGEIFCQGRRGTELSAIVSFPWSRVRYEEQGGHGVCGKTARWFT